MSTTNRVFSAMPTKSSRNAPDTNNATWFDYNENTEGYWDSTTDWYRTTKYSYYQHLAEINRGRKSGGSYWNDPYHTFQSNRDLIEIIGGELNLLPRQQKLAKAWFTQFDLDTWGERADLIACCLCARVVHEDEEDKRRTHPNVPDEHEQKPEEFAELATRFKLPETSVGRMYGKVDTHLRRNTGSPTRLFDRYSTDERNPHRVVTSGDES